MIKAYLRVSTDKQDVESQRAMILKWGHQNERLIDEFIEVTISSRKSEKARRLDSISDLGVGDILIVAELSRIGRSIVHIINFIEGLKEKGVRFISLRENLDLHGSGDTHQKVMITLFSMLAELERDLISQRTKEGLKAVKASGVKLGRPQGSYSSRVDKHKAYVLSMKENGVPNPVICRLLEKEYGVTITSAGLGRVLKKW